MEAYFVYAFPSLSTVLFPWYAIWPLPYAARAPALLVPYLVSLPILVVSLETMFGRTTFNGLLLVALAAYVASDYWNLCRRRRNVVAAPLA